MDSGNSGSLQSSSGGDEEYDSRAADSASTFMSGVPIPTPAPPFFDPLSTYLLLQQQNPNPSFLNSNLSWPAPSIRSDPNPMISQEEMLPAFVPATSDGVGPPTVAPPLNRNPKKRSRASRRAPTTVLTTDTTNFRAMVQEFTGIPAPPFNTSPFPRTLFGPRSNYFDAAQQPPYLRRPFALKVHPPPPFLASASSSLLTSDSTNNAAASSSTTPPPSNYQLPITNTANLFNNIPNQNILNSLLQTDPKFPLGTSPSKPLNSFEMPSSHQQTKIDDQFGLGSQTLAGLISSDQMAAARPRNDDGDNSNVARWSGDKDEGVQLNGSYNFQSEKTSFSAASTAGKAPENAADRGEGMVESWICSSD